MRQINNYAIFALLSWFGLSGCGGGTPSAPPVAATPAPSTAPASSAPSMSAPSATAPSTVAPVATTPSATATVTDTPQPSPETAPRPKPGINGGGVIAKGFVKMFVPRKTQEQIVGSVLAMATQPQLLMPPPGQPLPGGMPPAMPAPGEMPAPEQPPEMTLFPPDSAEFPAQKLILALLAKDYASVAPFISPKAKGIAGDLRDGKLTDDRLAELSEQVKAPTPVSAKPIPLGKTLNLLSGSGYTIQIEVAKESKDATEFKVRSLIVRKAPPSRVKK